MLDVAGWARPPPPCRGHVEHVGKGFRTLIFGGTRPGRFPSPEGGIVPTMPGGVDEFVMKHETCIGPPGGVKQPRMQVNDADLVRLKPVGTSATDPTRDPMTTNRPTTEHAERNTSKLSKVMALPLCHGAHAIEHLGLEHLEQASLLRSWAQANTPYDQRW